MEYLEKSKQLQEQLRELRTEIEVLKVGENQTLYDQLHEEQLRSGDDKYSTLKKVKVKSFIDFTALVVVILLVWYLFCSQSPELQVLAWRFSRNSNEDGFLSCTMASVLSYILYIVLFDLSVFMSN